MANKLPVWITVFASWRYVVTQWRTVLPPFALLALAGPVFLLWEPIENRIVDQFAKAHHIAWFLLEMLSVLPFLIFAAVALIPLHRAILTEPAQRGSRIPFRVGKRETIYFLLISGLTFVGTGIDVAALATMDSVIRVSLNVALAAGPYNRVTDLVVTLGVFVLVLTVIVAFIYGSSRLSLALPAIATDREKPLRHGWAIGSANGWRLVAVMWIAMLPVVLIMMAATTALDSATGPGELGGPNLIDGTQNVPSRHSDASPPFALDATGAVIAAMAFVFFALVEATALSLSYRTLGGMKERPIPSP